MGLKSFCLKKSLWVFHFAGASCNNCDIEILDVLTPRYDVERFGIKLVGSPRHADVILVSGSINQRDKPRLLEVYNQASKPVFVVAFGACGCTGGVFAEGNTFAGPVDRDPRMADSLLRVAADAERLYSAKLQLDLEELLIPLLGEG